MRKLLLTAIVLIPFIASAQKLQKPAIDKISGDTSWTTSKEKLYLHGNYLTAQGEAVVSWVTKIGKSKTTFLALNPQTLNQRTALMLLKGHKTYLKFADNSTITLTSSTDDIGKFNAGFAGDYLITNGSAVGLYELSASDIEKLRTTPITFLRIETSVGNFDCDIKPKNAEMLKKEIDLIANVK